METYQYNINQLIDIYNRKLVEYSDGSFYVNCVINIESIILTGNKNCNIQIINNCVNNPTVASILFIDSIKELCSTLPLLDQKKLLKELEIDDNFQPSLTVGLFTKCKLEAASSNTINIKSINLGNCYSDIPMYFKIINTGSVEGNCYTKELFKQIQDKFSQTKPEVKDLIWVDFSLYKYFIILLMVPVYLLIMSLLPRYDYRKNINLIV